MGSYDTDMDVESNTSPGGQEESSRGRRRTREVENEDDDDNNEDDMGLGSSKRRRRSRKGLDKKFECPHEGCGKSYSRAEHLYRHQLNRKLSFSFSSAYEKFSLGCANGSVPMREILQLFSSSSRCPKNPGVAGSLFVEAAVSRLRNMHSVVYCGPLYLESRARNLSRISCTSPSFKSVHGVRYNLHPSVFETGSPQG